MSGIGKPERVTQNRVIALFRDELKYRYLGDWSDRPANSNIEEKLLTAYLTKCKYTPEQISRAIYLLKTEAENPNRTLYENNKAVYNLLRYGVPVKIEAGKVTETVNLINWEKPDENDFAIAEEVTLLGNHERRPDLVLYVNGIAIGVIELKNSRVSPSATASGRTSPISSRSSTSGFSARCSSSSPGTIPRGCATAPSARKRKYFLKWKEDEADNSRFKLDKYLLKMCRKDRLIELMHDFVLFDGGVKKLPRVHQYFGVKAAQEHVRLQGRHHLAHAGQRQEHRDGAAGQVDSGEQAQRPRRSSSPTAMNWTSRSSASSPKPASPSSAPAAAAT
jgi:type I restriction enzyme R subunit